MEIVSYYYFWQCKDANKDMPISQHKLTVSNVLWKLTLSLGWCKQTSLFLYCMRDISNNVRQIKIPPQTLPLKRGNTGNNIHVAIQLLITKHATIPMSFLLAKPLRLTTHEPIKEWQESDLNMYHDRIMLHVRIQRIAIKFKYMNKDIPHIPFYTLFPLWNLLNFTFQEIFKTEMLYKKLVNCRTGL